MIVADITCPPRHRQSPPLPRCLCDAASAQRLFQRISALPVVRAVQRINGDTDLRGVRNLPGNSHPKSVFEKLLTA
ncbi:MAG TPA: hypothetical protein VJU59_40255 [Paraburkholderia sp.]|uniref:hypothetical protein n=1 Tax=Paraburkholderia sp. TaxID=1926495 RepID=UPI002B47CD9A|nr:hypothetical protein [Paraburkholderia sp.]HKR45832.1 hypothetical protein [Paraburkholderia sp.]